MNMILKRFFFFYIISVLTSCIGDRGSIIVNDGIASNDSVSLQRVDTLTLHIGNRIKPIPTCSQLIDDSCNVKYIILDARKLNVFDFEADSLIAKVDVKSCGNLRDYSGFYCAPDGKSYLFNYGDKRLSVIDDNGTVSKVYYIPEDILKDVSPEPIDGSHIIVGNGNAILSGLPLSGKTRFSKEDPISLKIDLQSGTVTQGAAFSDEYNKAFFGGLYFNTIYQCKGDSSRIVYSFPASNYIYRYDANLSLIDSLYMGSRYTKEIKPCGLSFLEAIKDKDKRLDYYISENSYSNIAFDQQHGLYYRIANHPRIIERKGNFRTPFSIIVMDTDGNLLAETPIVDDYYNIVTLNSHVYKGGLLLQLISDDEDVIKFVYYKLIK